jgi:hypothetical protein
MKTRNLEGYMLERKTEKAMRKKQENTIGGDMKTIQF